MFIRRVLCFLILVANETAEDLEVHSIILAIGILLGFENGRKSRQSIIVDDCREGIQPYLAFADMIVPILVAGERLLAIVEMEHPELIQTNHPIELIKDLDRGVL